MAILERKVGLSQSHAAELLSRFTAPRVIAVQPGRKLYRANGGARHIFWIDNPDGSVTFEEHDFRCTSCPG